MSRFRARLALPILVATALPIAFLGCTEDNGRDQEPELAQVALIAADYGASVVHAADVYTLTMLGFLADEPGAPGRGPDRHPAPGDTLLPGILTCPVIIADVGVGAAVELTFDYGTGCQTTFDGSFASGEIVVLAAERPLGGFDITCDFDAFVRGTRGLNGTLLALGKLDTIDVSLAGMSYTGPEGSVIVDGSLEFKRTTALPQGDGLCVSWSLENGLVVVQTTRATYEVEIIHPVTITSCCPWPTTGSVQVSAAGFIPAKIDFGDGGCDAEVDITIAGRTETVTLGGSSGG